MKIIHALLILLFISVFGSPADAQQPKLKNWDRLDYMIRGTVPFKMIYP